MSSQGHCSRATDIRLVTVYVYGLADPDTGEVRYVGKSANPNARLSMHLKSGTHYVREWCRELASENKHPRVVILKEVKPGQDANASERNLIKKHDSPRLLNVRGTGQRISRLHESLRRGRELRELDWARSRILLNLGEGI